MPKPTKSLSNLKTKPTRDHLRKIYFNVYSRLITENITVITPTHLHNIIEKEAYNYGLRLKEKQYHYILGFFKKNRTLIPHGKELLFQKGT